MIQTTYNTNLEDTDAVADIIMPKTIDFLYFKNQLDKSKDLLKQLEETTECEKPETVTLEILKNNSIEQYGNAVPESTKCSSRKSKRFNRA